MKKFILKLINIFIGFLVKKLKKRFNIFEIFLRINNLIFSSDELKTCSRIKFLKDFKFNTQSNDKISQFLFLFSELNKEEKQKFFEHLKSNDLFNISQIQIGNRVYSLYTSILKNKVKHLIKKIW